MIGPAHDRHRVAALDHPRLDDAQVGPGDRSVGEGPDPALFTEPSGERPAGNAGVRDLQHDMVTDPPAFPDQRGCDVDSHSGQVLPEHPAWQRPAQLHRPGVQILPRVRVNSLVVPTVMPQVADPVTDQPTPADAFGARSTHLDSGADRPFVNTGHTDFRVLGTAGGPKIH